MLQNSAGMLAFLCLIFPVDLVGFTRYNSQISDRKAQKEVRTVIELRNICKTYKNKKGEFTALNNVSITGSERIKIVYNGESSFTPVVANTILSSGVPLNIQFTKRKSRRMTFAGFDLLSVPSCKVFDHLTCDKQPRHCGDECGAAGDIPALSAFVFGVRGTDTMRSAAYGHILYGTGGDLI